MIRVLEPFIADKIAAGEVIERPLSIVKELTENAIDAGATNIIVEIRGGGKKYIRVTDNGCGIPAEEVPIAFQRHATGKISELEDLSHIETLGFRGEALASICAISRLTIYTKTADSPLGTKMEIQGGRMLPPEPVGVNKGTTMIVEDVFYNTPARRKFMRSDAAEASAIIDLVQKLALFYANIGFQIINNGKTVLTTSGDGEAMHAITRVYPTKDFSNLLEIHGEYVTGYISNPGVTKTNRTGQIFFVNGRYIKSEVIEKGLMEGYGDRIFSGHPIAVLFLQVPPDSIDVNIHPNKKEIKFLDAGRIKSDLAQAVRDVIYQERAIPAASAVHHLSSEENQEKSNVITKTDKTTAEVSKEPENNSIVANKIEEATTTEQVGIRDFLSRKRREDSAANLTSCENPRELGSPHTEYTEMLYDDRSESQVSESQINEFQATESKTTESREPALRIPIPAPSNRLFDFQDLTVCGYVFNAYIITRAGDNLFVLDQHAAHERILYEQLIQQYNREEHLPQPILTPILLNTSSDVYHGTREWMDVLRRIGYDVDDFGTNTFIIRGIPANMDLSEAETFARETIDIQDNEVHLHRNVPAVNKLIMRSCKAAVKANDHLSEKEIRELLESLSKCVNPFSCPHGRPTFIRISKYEIERAFRRK